jgi:2'-5' RNA ligase
MAIRSFISVDLEKPSILDSVNRLQDEFKRTRADLKLVERENIHLTIRFLGDVWEGLMDKLMELVSTTSFKPFKMELRRVGVFPNIRRPRVVWIGITKGVNELRNISEQLEEGLSGLGFKRERRRFSPHITIARVRSGKNRQELIDAVTRERDREFGEFLVNHINLKKSVLTPRGPIYSTLTASRF